MTGLLFVLLGTVYGAVMGASFASFAGVVAERGAAGLPLTGRSACACGRQLRLAENIPVIGWLRVGGVARCCGARLPVGYLRWESGMGAYGGLAGGLAWWAWWQVGGSWPLNAVLAGGGLALFVRCAWHHAPGGPAKAER